MRLTIVILLIIFFSGINSFSQNNNISHLDLPIPHKNPATAFVYSLVIPGLGQMYNEDVGKGFIMFAGAMVSGAAYALLEPKDSKNLAGGIYLLFDMVSVIEATARAYKINEENQKKRARIINKRGIDVGLFMNGYGGVNVGVAYKF